MTVFISRHRAAVEAVKAMARSSSIVAEVEFAMQRHRDGSTDMGFAVRLQDLNGRFAGYVAAN